jgi:methionyl-tRNA synthetase
MSGQKFSITTAIDYPNGMPHLGHAYEKTVTDSYARWYRLLGRDVFFLTGTDENGQNLVKSAEALGLTTQAFVDQNVAHFKELCAKLHISYDDFIRTTEPRHAEATHAIWKKLEAKGDIYFGQYEGMYCPNCEAYYTELQAPDSKCPAHYKPLEKIVEEGYFLKTSQYQSWIIEHIKSNTDFVSPELSRKEIIARLEGEPMRDLSITRKHKGWGIPVPDKPEYVIYTWFDAVINYYTVSEPLGYWPNDVHVIGRDILWFHSVIWPIMLHAAGLPLPFQIYTHGMVLASDGKKMSKSLGNGVDPFEILTRVPVDSFRYYMLRGIPSNANGAFILTNLFKSHQAELGNDYGNLLMRVVKLAIKRLGNTMDGMIDGKPIALAFNFEAMIKEFSALMDKREHHRAIERLWEEVIALNKYINDQAPWGIKEDADEAEQKRFVTVMYNGLYGIDVVSQMLTAFMPTVPQMVLNALGVKEKVLNTKPKVYRLSEPEVPFPRFPRFWDIRDSRSIDADGKFVKGEFAVTLNNTQGQEFVLSSKDAEKFTKQFDTQAKKSQIKEDELFFYKGKFHQSLASLPALIVESQK